MSERIVTVGRLTRLVEKAGITPPDETSPTRRHLTGGCSRYEGLCRAVSKWFLLNNAIPAECSPSRTGPIAATTAMRGVGIAKSRVALRIGSSAKAMVAGTRSCGPSRCRSRSGVSAISPECMIRASH
jgi:hypothetical protein